MNDNKTNSNGVEVFSDNSIPNDTPLNNVNPSSSENEQNIEPSYAQNQYQNIEVPQSQMVNNQILETGENKNHNTKKGNLVIGLIVCILIIIFVLIITNTEGLGDLVGNLVNPNEETFSEDVTLSGYSCFASECSVTIEDIDYTLDIDNTDFFTILNNYTEYIKLNIYYVEKGEDRYITNYELFVASTNEDIASITTESELREKIGLYSLGTHTDTFTLTYIGLMGYGFNDDTSFTYRNYTLVNSDNFEYKMTYYNTNGTLNLTVNNKYTVTFEVTEGSFGYEYTITKIQ